MRVGLGFELKANRLKARRFRDVAKNIRRMSNEASRAARAALQEAEEARKDAKKAAKMAKLYLAIVRQASREASAALEATRRELSRSDESSEDCGDGFSSPSKVQTNFYSGSSPWPQPLTQSPCSDVLSLRESVYGDFSFLDESEDVSATPAEVSTQPQLPSKLPADESEDMSTQPQSIDTSSHDERKRSCDGLRITEAASGSKRCKDSPGWSSVKHSDKCQWPMKDI